VAHEAFPGVKRPVAAIGVAEKGTSSVELRVEGRGGHASTPARNGPTVRLSRAVLRIDRSPMPARVPATTVELITTLVALIRERGLEPATVSALAGRREGAAA